MADASESVTPPPRGRGRPPASPIDRRAVIHEAAVASFAELGYERTTIRGVAERAGVDAKLVMHYFGTKQELFVACVDAPPEVGVALGVLKLTPRKLWGRMIVDVLWRSRRGNMMNTITGVIRAAASEPKAAALFREFYLTNMMMPNMAKLDVSDKELRAVMMSTLIAGWVFATNVLELDELTAASERKRKKLLAALVQEILTADL